jgi:hypothetical protein
VIAGALAAFWFAIDSPPFFEIYFTVFNRNRHASRLRGGYRIDPGLPHCYERRGRMRRQRACANSSDGVRTETTDATRFWILDFGFWIETAVPG